jgi:signal transduction histidine kinase
MAVDLHGEECPLGTASESLTVAKRQLRLMEEYIQRFLQLGKPSESAAAKSVDLSTLVEDLLPLVQPTARHAGVTLCWEPSGDVGTVAGDAERLGQMVINLLINAFEAAVQGRTRSDLPAEVRIALAQQSPDRVTLSISDTGPGPAESVKHTLFEPFVTEKPDGVGLGLSVAREVAEQHGGRIEWHRADGITQFTVELPCQVTEDHCVEAAGCR